MDNTNDPIGVLRAALEQISYVADMGTPNGRMLFDIAKTAIAAIQHSEQRETVPAGEEDRQAKDQRTHHHNQVLLLSYRTWDEFKELATLNRVTGTADEFLHLGWRAGYACKPKSPVAAPVPEAKAEQVGDGYAYDEAANLAKAIYSQHYRKGTEQWRVLPDIRGVISQISNMVAGMTRARPAAPAVKHEASELAEQLREYAGNPGYSHGDYADTMRQAADALNSRSPVAAAPDTTRMDYLEKYAVIAAPGQTVRAAIDAALSAAAPSADAKAEQEGGTMQSVGQFLDSNEGKAAARAVRLSVASPNAEAKAKP